MSEYIRYRGNGTKAALAAGYGNGNPVAAAARASENVKKPAIKRQIEKLTRQYDITPERVLTRLDNLSLKAQEAGNYPAAVRAEELIGKSLGMWVDRSVSVNLDLTGEHVAAIRALASRRSNKNGGGAGDDARVIEATATTDSGNAVKSYNDDYDKSAYRRNSVIDQRVTSVASSNVEPSDASDADGHKG